MSVLDFKEQNPELFWEIHRIGRSAQRNIDERKRRKDFQRELEDRRIDIDDLCIQP